MEGPPRGGGTQLFSTRGGGMMLRAGTPGSEGGHLGFQTPGLLENEGAAGQTLSY